jgi:uncharacterized LabA/DUF88 family protein
MNEQHKKFRFKLRGKKTLVVVDWANVYKWHESLGQKINLQKLFNYMNQYTEVFDQRFYHGYYENEQWTKDIITTAEEAGYSVISKEGKWVPVYLNKQSHFKNIVKKLFDVLDNNKYTNSEIGTKLYELRDKIDSRLADTEPNYDSEGNVQGELPAYASEDQALYDSVYELIEELDAKLKKLNISIDELQVNLLEPVQRRKCDFDVEIARDVCNLADSFDTLILFSGDGDYAALVADLISKGKKIILVFSPGHKGGEYEPLVEDLKGRGKSYTLFVCTVNNIKEEIVV